MGNNNYKIMNNNTLCHCTQLRVLIDYSLKAIAEKLYYFPLNITQNVLQFIYNM